jgi:hypothetical protein
MKRACFAVVLLAAGVLGGTAKAAGPSLFGFGRVAYPNPMQFNEVDLETGRHRTVAQFTNVFGIVNTGPAAYDIASNLWYVQVGEMDTANATQHLYTITAATGQLRTNVALGDVTFFHLYSVSGALYGFASPPGTQKTYRINPGTGALTPLGLYTNSTTIQGMAYDPLSNRFYAATQIPDSSTQQYLVVNGTSGAFINSLVRTNDAGSMYCAHGGLYTIYSRGGTNRIARVNLGSGVETVVQVLSTNFGGITSLYMDHTADRLYIGGSSTTNLITVLNPTNGATLGRYVMNLNHLVYFTNPWVTCPAISSGVRISWDTVTGFVYRVQSSASIVSPAWANVGSLVTGRVGTTSLVDSAGSGQNLYRVLTKP